MLQYANGFRWRFSEQDSEGRQTRRETQINHWSKDDDFIFFYSSQRICECRITIKELNDLVRHGYDGIMLRSKRTSIVLHTTGDRESGGLLIDLFNDLVEAVNVDRGPSTSGTKKDYTPVAAKTSVKNFLETYLRIRQ
jgi:hypothetical protein